MEGHREEKPLLLGHLGCDCELYWPSPGGLLGLLFTACQNMLQMGLLSTFPSGSAAGR